MWPIRAGAFLLLVAGVLIGCFVYVSEMSVRSVQAAGSASSTDAHFPFKFGLDLIGGTHLVYEADTSQLGKSDVTEAMRALREVIERRVNLFGVSEPLVQVESASVLAGGTSTERLIVELPGVTDLDEAVRLIGQTPTLEFKLVKNPLATTSVERYAATGLTGRYLQHAQLQFGSNSRGNVPTEPVVAVTFNEEGKELFGKITTEHVGDQLAIFLDGELLSEPVIREQITGGIATISGRFTPEEAKELVRNLNIGALPVPVTLASSETVGASLGSDTLAKGLKAGLIGLGLVAVFMILWYRLPGFVATVALAMYVVIMLALFKLVPVTLTAAGIAGFILSIGMAVDANVLIFERTKEELLKGEKIHNAVHEGFVRAWPSIRDGHLTCFISAAVLFWFGTSLVQGFALVYGIGILISLFTAIVVTRSMLLALGELGGSSAARQLFGSGILKV